MLRLVELHRLAGQIRRMNFAVHINVYKVFRAFDLPVCSEISRHVNVHISQKNNHFNIIVYNLHAHEFCDNQLYTAAGSAADACWKTCDS
jgi:hypothetical protein